MESLFEQRYCQSRKNTKDRRALKFILNDYISDYKSCLLKLGLLPLMHVLDFYDIMFFCKALNQPSVHFNILDSVQFCHNNTRSSFTNKLQYVYSSNNYAKQKHLGCQKRRDQSEAAII